MPTRPRPAASRRARPRSGKSRCMRTHAVRVSLAACLALLSGTCAAVAQATVDQYGGVVRGVGSPSGYFQVKQVGDRWLFVTPEGNGMWMTGVFGVIYSDSVDDLGSSGMDRIIAKYGGGPGSGAVLRGLTPQRRSR